VATTSLTPKKSAVLAKLLPTKNSKIIMLINLFIGCKDKNFHRLIFLFHLKFSSEEKSYGSIFYKVKRSDGFVCQGFAL
jgi:hypothetical protein